MFTLSGWLSFVCHLTLNANYLQPFIISYKVVKNGLGYHVEKKNLLHSLVTRLRYSIYYE